MTRIMTKAEAIEYVMAMGVDQFKATSYVDYWMYSIRRMDLTSENLDRGMAAVLKPTKGAMRAARPRITHKMTADRRARHSERVTIHKAHLAALGIEW